MDAASAFGDHLADAVRAAYRRAFTDALAAGRAAPLLVPSGLLGAFVVPTLWLALPHAGRPWLFRARWLVMLFVVFFDLRLARSASSANFAAAYASGLMAAWGIVFNANLLLWKNPQRDSARAIRRSRVRAAANGEAHGRVAVGHGGGHEKTANGEADGVLRRRADRSEKPVTDKPVEEKGELVWEPFPADESFWHRLNWAVDLAWSFRGTGWTHSISAIPRAQVPSEIRPGTPVDTDSIPVVTGHGYRRCLTEREFLCSRLRTGLVCYLVLDLLAVLMMKDPYFVLGPGHLFPLPVHLQALSPRLLAAYRQVLGLAGIISALDGAFSLNDLACYYLGRYVFPRYAELWLYPQAFGPPSAVLDRGIAGWWGAWWHQTFRMQFLAPSAFLLRHGYVAAGARPAVTLSLLLVFAQSGFLHAMGSATTIPPTSPWRPPAFFLFQALGIVVQKPLAAVVRRRLPRPPPRALRRAANLLFTLAWLHMTADFLLDDLAASGLWLFEPVPVSPLRWMGLGHAADHWWRWDREQFPKWYAGLRWWEMGVAL